MTSRDPAMEALRLRAKDADIVDVARRLGARLKPNNRYLVGACPAGCATVDGFVIDPRKKLFLCRPTGGKEGRGDIIAMVQHATSCNFREAVAFIVGEPNAPKTTLATPARQRQAEAEEEEGQREGRVARPRPPTTTAQALALWDAAVNPIGTLAEVYLTRDRALSLDDDLSGSVLRWHAGANALLVLFRNILTGEARAVLRVVLDQAGHLVKPRMFTGPAGGSAAMLDGFETVTTGIHVGEGVETCMAGRQYDLKPMWALGSTVAIAKFAPLAGVQTVTLLQENDGGKSEKACNACAGLWRGAGRQVKRVIPRPGCCDLNDVLILETIS